MDEHSAKKDQLLKAASQTLRMYLDQIEALQNENKNLKVEIQSIKSASQDKVTLQKVASASPEKVNDLVDLLINHSMLPESERQKCAKVLQQSPDNILDIAVSAIKSSEAPIESGYGIKAASEEHSPAKESDMIWKQTLSSYEVNYSK